MNRKILGLDMGGTTIKMGLFEESGKLEEKWEIPTCTENKGISVVNDIADAIREKLIQRQIKKEEIIGIGIGVPGVVAKNGEVKVCVNVGWKDKPLSEELQSASGLPVYVGNDANLAALGEVWQGSGKGYQNAVMLTLGTGIGGGVVLDGKVISGTHALAGEIGHMHVNDNETEICGCKGKGCLEQYASATGIVRVTKCFLEKEIDELITAKDVFESAKRGDEKAIKAVNIAGYYLGMTLANLSLVIDPDIFIIGGGVSKAGSYFLEIIQKHYLKSMKISDEGARIYQATLGNDAGIYGAAKLVIDNMLF